MKYRIKIDDERLQVDETVEGNSEDVLWSQIRAEVARRAPFLVRPVIRAMSDQALWDRLAKIHRDRSGVQEPAPTNAREFFALAEKAGYATKLG